MAKHNRIPAVTKKRETVDRTSIHFRPRIDILSPKKGISRSYRVAATPKDQPPQNTRVLGGRPWFDISDSTLATNDTPSELSASGWNIKSAKRAVSKRGRRPTKPPMGSIDQPSNVEDHLRGSNRSIACQFGTRSIRRVPNENAHRPRQCVVAFSESAWVETATDPSATQQGWGRITADIQPTGRSAIVDDQ